MEHLCVIGFQKCGTSAFIRKVKDIDGMSVIINKNGSLEVPWPTIKNIESANGAALAPFTIHKCAAYWMFPEAIDYLLESLPSRKLLLFVRDPRAILVSWHNMHRSMALNGSELFPNHFAIKDSDFFKSCTLEEYFQRRQSAFSHVSKLNKLLQKVPLDRFMISSQEYLANDTSSAIRAILDHAFDSSLNMSSQVSNDSHKGFADTQKLDLEEPLNSKLLEMKRQMDDLITNSGVWHTPIFD